MFYRFRHWLKQQTPINQPKLTKIKLEGVINDFGTVTDTIQFNLPLLKSTSISPDLTLSSPHLKADNLSEIQITREYEDYFQVIDEPQIINNYYFSLEVFPDTIDLLEVLGKTLVVGKKYGGEDKIASQQKLPFDPTTIDKSICKHGAPRYACALCDEEEERRRLRRNQFSTNVKTINVFDLLLPFLEPPFEYMLDQPILFPPGRRPYDFQVEGVRFLVDKNSALLGDDMGLGKTIQTIIAIRILIRRKKIKKVLILCPLSLLGNWEREIKKWAPELYVLKIRGVKELRELLWKNNSIIYLTTYETLRDDTNRFLVPQATFNLVVLDEVQRIKNPDTGISRTVRKLMPEYRWGLSGTPLENKLDDVIAIFRFLGPKVFHTSKQYSSYQVRTMIRPYFLRRRIQDVLADLPSKSTSEIWLDLNDHQRQIYDNFLIKAKTKMTEPGITRIHIFALITQLKKICNMEPETGDSCKIDYLETQLAEIVESGYKALVFSQFPNVTLIAVEQKLREYDPAIFHGGLNQRQREILFADFQESDSPKVLLASLKAAGVGLNLTRANHVFHFDHWWNPAVAKQAEARAWRMGQENSTVFVHDIYTNDTVEERIYRILEEKQALFDEVIDDLSSEYTMASFTNEDLYSIFDLEAPSKAGTSDRVEEISDVSSLEKIKQLDHRQFEELVARYYETLGFKVRVTGGAYDKGVDIVARRYSELGEENIIVQCKHYPNTVIGPVFVREMIGTRTTQKDSTSAMLVVSGLFSQEAIRLAERHQIKLIDGNYLVTLLKRHQINF